MTNTAPHTLTDIEPRLDTVLCADGNAFHRMAYADWGAKDAAETVVCVHGLTRQGRDFDDLARALVAEGYRVLCPDMPGRGRSDWLSHPESYSYELYIRDITVLLAKAGVERVHWVGTSMGGVMGMVVAFMQNSPAQSLFINDIGPFLTQACLKRINDYLGLDPRFKSFDQALLYIRETHAPFGRLSDAQWRHLAEHAVCEVAAGEGEGAYRLRYDPAIKQPFQAACETDIDLWPIWDSLTLPTMVMRGADTDVLPADIADQMTQRGPKARLHTIEGVGHAPALMDDAQIGLVRDWVRENRF